MTRPSPVTPEAFVLAWRDAATLADVLEATGMTSVAARSRASFYRKRGVRLKRFPQAKLDVAALSRLAKEATT